MTFIGNYGHPGTCMDECRRKGYKYAGLQYSSECRCGKEIKKELIAPASDCYFPCLNDVTRKCGGPWRNSIYKTGQ